MFAKCVNLSSVCWLISKDKVFNLSSFNQEASTDQYWLQGNPVYMTLTLMFLNTDVSIVKVWRTLVVLVWCLLVTSVWQPPPLLFFQRFRDYYFKMLWIVPTKYLLSYHSTLHLPHLQHFIRMIQLACNRWILIKAVIVKLFTYLYWNLQICLESY